MTIKPYDFTEELAYLCGVFAGDGSLNIRKKKWEYSLKCVGNPKDERRFYDECIYPLFEKVFSRRLHMKLCDGRKTYGFVCYSKEIVTFLSLEIGLPIGRKYDHLHIPLHFINDENLCKAFIR